MRFHLDQHLISPLRTRIKHLFSYPVILRSVGEQQASNVYLAASDEELDAAISSLSALRRREVYVIEYVRSTHFNGMHRRLRAAFVRGVPTLMRADYDSHWIVKGRKTESVQTTYSKDMSLLAHADAILRKPEQLGEGVWKTLLEIGRIIPLDVFGLDFDVDQTGRIVFFESNATMNLLSNAPPEIDYPPEAQQTFLERIDGLFVSLAEGGSRAGTHS
jgi:hypothetical protein